MFAPPAILLPAELPLMFFCPAPQMGDSWHSQIPNDVRLPILTWFRSAASARCSSGLWHHLYMWFSSLNKPYITDVKHFLVARGVSPPDLKRSLPRFNATHYSWQEKNVQGIENSLFIATSWRWAAARWVRLFRSEEGKSHHGAQELIPLPQTSGMK